MKIRFSRFRYSLIFLLAIAINCNAQTWTWARSWAPALGSDFSNTRSIYTDPAGNILTAGVYVGTITSGIYTLTCPANVNSACSFLMKYDNSGNVLWAKSAVYLSVPSFSYSSIGSSVCSDVNGNVLVAGGCASSSQSTAFLTKYNPSGTLVWGKSPLSNNGEKAYSVSCDTSKNVYLSGVFTSSVVFGPDTLIGAGTRNLFLVKYDPNGNQIWSRCNSSGSVFLDVGNSIGVSVSAEPNGNVFITGAFVGPSMILGSYTLTGNSGAGNIFLAKYDSAGNVLWATSAAATTSNNIACSVSADGIGNAYISGYYTSFNLTFGTNTITNLVGTQNMFLAKYNGSGNNLWVKNSRNNADDEIGYSVSSNSASVFLAGTTTSILTIGTTVFNPTSSSIGDNGFITKFDVNGNLLYGEVLDDGGNGWFTVCADKYCDVYIAGDFVLKPLVIGSNTLMAVPVFGGKNPLTAKLSFSGMCVTGTGTNEISDFKDKSKLYPNPNSGSFKLKTEEEIENGKLILLNSLGQKVHEQKITHGENNITIKDLSKGLYHYMILENKQLIHADKVIIE